LVTAADAAKMRRSGPKSADTALLLSLGCGLTITIAEDGSGIGGASLSAASPHIAR